MKKSKSKFNTAEKTVIRSAASTAGGMAAVASITAVEGSISALAATSITNIAVSGATLIAAAPAVPAVMGTVLGAAAAGAGVYALKAVGSYIGGLIADEITHDSDDEKESDSYFEKGIDTAVSFSASHYAGDYIDKVYSDELTNGTIKRVIGSATGRLARESAKTAAGNVCSII